MNIIRTLKNKGDISTLFIAFIYFNISIMTWVLLASISSNISHNLLFYNNFVLSDSSKALLLSLPIFSAAILRIILGFFVDSFGPKKVALFSQFIVLITLTSAFILNKYITYNQFLILGIGLGFAGGSFSIALPQVGQWYPPKLQGLVLGIVGAGSFGIVIDFIFIPKIAEEHGLEGVFGLMLILNIIVFILYIFIVKDAPNSVYKKVKKKFINYINLLKDIDTWWFCLFYSISSGVFIGFTVYLNVYLIDNYSYDMNQFSNRYLQSQNIKIVSGYFVAFCIFAGSILRPFGGSIADKIGGIKSLYYFYIIVASFVSIFCYIDLSFYYAVIFLFIIMTTLGMANGAVFQLVPQRFAKDIGIITGIIGFTGGLSASLFIQLFAISKSMFNTYDIGFFVLSIVVIIGIIGLSTVKKRWRTTWGIYSGARI